MRVAILGTGVVGNALGRGFLSRGHEVKMGSRDAAKSQAWAKEAGGKASGGTFADAAQFGELVVLATLGSGTESALSLAGAKNLAGKVIIDTTNPLEFSTGLPRLSISGNDSLGERVQRWAAGAKVVKAFNTVASPHMVDPKFPDGKPDMLIAGEDAAAKKQVAAICEDFGWGVVDLGGILESRELEAMCVAYCVYAIRTGNWNIAFKLLKK